MSSKGPKKLHPLEAKKRDVLGSGSQSIVLAESHNEALLVTRQLVADKIDMIALLRNKRGAEVLDIPVKVDTNVSLSWLIHPTRASFAKRIYQHQFSALQADLRTFNTVYKMPRREGNLENRKTLRYKEDSIDALEKKLMASLAFLHRNGFTHNDVAPKNILYAGTYPKLSWHLSDLGSATKNSPATHDLKVQKDLLDAGHVIAKMRQTLIDKQEQQKKVNPYLLSIMPEYFRQRSERMGISPLKPVAPTHADTGEPELKAKKRLVFGRKKAR